MPFKDKEHARLHQQKRVKTRRANYFANKVCVICNSSENLVLDHIDPSKKVSHRIWSWSQERIDEETSKCQVLCESCHHLKTLLFDRKLAPHGSIAGYERYGCRCENCKEAKQTKNKKRLRLTSTQVVRRVANAKKRVRFSCEAPEDSGD